MEDIAFIDDEIHATFSSTEIKEKDVFLNITGASIGRSAVADKRVLNGNVNQHVCIIRTKENDLESYFLNCFLLSKYGQRQIDSYQAGGNRQGLNFGQIKSFQIPLPPLSEQTAIATALGDADSLISSLEKLISKKRAIKEGAMQELLTGKRRLPDFGGEGRYKQTEVGIIPEDWIVETLGKIGTFRKGKGIKKENIISDGFPCIRYGEIYTHHNEYIKKFYSFISSEIAMDSQRIKQGDLLFSGSGETAEEIGKCVAYCEDQEAYAGGDIIIFSPFECDAKYLGFLMNNEIIVKQKTQMAQGDAIVHIYSNNLSKVILPLPPTKAEQTAIAKILLDMDREIEKLEQKLTKYRQIKQGMMEELLTGRTRLV